MIRLSNFYYQRFAKPVAIKVNTRVSSEIPIFKLSKIHIQNAKLLTTREELLELLPKGGIVAELGVDEGEFSKAILEINKPKKLHLVDFWGSKRYNQDKRRKVETRFKNNIEANNLEINLGLSTKVVERYEDNYFDWIYIDTSHSYKTTIEELELYSSKVKPNGFIAGHDYVMGNWPGMVRYGVIEAVYEFCVKHNWEIIFQTTELEESLSFAIRRITPDSKV
ncbi:MAG: class I SAM-dependent methyltransferase [Xenococcus sp. (in: cyanobacteria)]